MWGYFCIGFIDFILAGKKLSDFTTLFSPHDFNKNDSTILSYFKDEWINKIKLSNQRKFSLYEIKKKRKLFYQWD